MNQESKAKSSPPPPPLCQAKHRPQLVHSDILSHLFPSNAEKEKREHSNERTLPVPLDKSILLKKHRLFAQHASANLRTSTYTFRRNSLDPQMKHRMVSLETDQVELLFVSVSNDSSLFFSLDNSTTTIDPINHFSTSIRPDPSRLFSIGQSDLFTHLDSFCGSYCCARRRRSLPLSIDLQLVVRVRNSTHQI